MPAAKKSAAAIEADAIQEKRASYDGSEPVKADVPIAEQEAGVETLGRKADLSFVQEGQTVEVFAGGKSVGVLDAQGILGVQRAFSKFGAQV